MFTITYRTLSGTTATITIYASDEANARAAFHARHDGRIISIVQAQAERYT